MTLAEETDPLLTVHEVSRSWRVSKMTIYRLIHSGQLPAIRIGRSFRVKESVAKRYLDQNG